jgi:hypothetical protein
VTGLAALCGANPVLQATLQRLELSQRFGPSFTSEALVGALPLLHNLRVLSLARCGVDVNPVVVACLRGMPALEEFNVNETAFTGAGITEDAFRTSRAERLRRLVALCGPPLLPCAFAALQHATPNLVSAALNVSTFTFADFVIGLVAPDVARALNWKPIAAALKANERVRPDMVYPRNPSHQPYAPERFFVRSAHQVQTRDVGTFVVPAALPRLRVIETRVVPQFLKSVAGLVNVVATTADDV